MAWGCEGEGAGRGKKRKARWRAGTAVRRRQRRAPPPHLMLARAWCCVPQDKKALEETPGEIKKRKRQERDPLHQGLIVQRANLKARDFQIDLAAKLNKTQVGGGVGVHGSGAAPTQQACRLWASAQPACFGEHVEPWCLPCLRA